MNLKHLLALVAVVICFILHIATVSLSASPNSPQDMPFHGTMSLTIVPSLVTDFSALLLGSIPFRPSFMFGNAIQGMNPQKDVIRRNKWKPNGWGNPPANQNQLHMWHINLRTPTWDKHIRWSLHNAHRFDPTHNDMSPTTNRYTEKCGQRCSTCKNHGLCRFIAWNRIVSTLTMTISQTYNNPSLTCSFREMLRNSGTKKCHLMGDQRPFNRRDIYTATLYFYLIL